MLFYRKMSSPHQKTSQHSRNLADLRVEYARHELSEQNVNADPVRQLIQWLDDAVAAAVHEPNAMTLATSDGTRPSARIVLLKNIDADGLVFFTNYHSRKASQLDANPHAALVFWWPELQRQVRVDGTVARIPAELSDEYFLTRPPPSRVGAAASPQSQVIASRQELERLFAEVQAKYPDGNVPRPAHWGGYRVRPHTVEFWQGRPSRLHDRIEYSWNEERAAWVIRRLAP
jgi:pyridoxamine 5'-phosphate oxidase